MNLYIARFLDSTSQDEEGEGIVLEENKLPWEGTDRDYQYEEVYIILWYNGMMKCIYLKQFLFIPLMLFIWLFIDICSASGSSLPYPS